VCTQTPSFILYSQYNKRATKSQSAWINPGLGLLQGGLQTIILALTLQDGSEAFQSAYAVQRNFAEAFRLACYFLLWVAKEKTAVSRITSQL